MSISLKDLIRASIKHCNEKGKTILFFFFFFSLPVGVIYIFFPLFGGEPFQTKKSDSGKKEEQERRHARKGKSAEAHGQGNR